MSATKRFLSSLRCPECFWGPISLLFTGFWGKVSLGPKHLFEKLHSPPLTGEVKNAWYRCSTGVVLV